MQNEQGFSIVEVLLGTILFLSMILTILPISIQLYEERQSIKEEKLIHYFLFEEMKKSHRSHSVTNEQISQHQINNRKFQIIYTKEDSYIKACAQWKDIRSLQKEVCFYDIL